MVAAVSSVKNTRSPAQLAAAFVNTARNVPVTLLAQEMVQQSPEIHAEISALLGLEPDADIGLKGGIASILMIDPQRVTKMIQTRPEEVLKIAHAVNVRPDVLADIERIKNSGENARWNVANAIRNGMMKIVADRIGTNPAWIAAAEAAIPSMNLAEGHRLLGQLYASQGLYREAYRSLSTSLRLDPNQPQVTKLVNRIGVWIGATGA